MVFLALLNPFSLFRSYVRTPIEAFVLKQYLDYKIRTHKGIHSVKELLYRVGIVTVFVTAILWISVFMYVVFYYTYMPNVTHVRPVHLQFKSCEEHMGVCSFPSAHVQLTKRSHMLMSAQPYRIRLTLDMPESQINKDLGMFMVCAQMRAKGGVLVSSSCRAAMLRHRCKHLCFGRLPRNPNSKVDAYSQWASVAKVLNYSEKGPRKSVVEWKACWTEMKNKAKCKVNQARHKSRFSRIEVLPKLSPYETRIIELSEQAAEEQRMKLSTSSNEGSDAEESHTTPEVQKQSEITPKLEQTNKSQPHVQLPRVTLTRQIQSVSDCRNEHVDRLSKAINTLAESHTAIAVSQENMASSHRAIADALQALRNCFIFNKSDISVVKIVEVEADSFCVGDSVISVIRSRIHQLIRTIVLAPLLIAGLNEEKQQLQVELFSDFEDDQDLPVTDAYVELQTRFAQVYSCELHIEAHFQGLRYVMFHWPKVSALVGISTNLFFVSLIFILSWYHLQDGLPDFVKFHGKFGSEVKQEDDKKAEGKIKLERDVSSNFFEDDKDFFLDDLQQLEDPNLKKT